MHSTVQFSLPSIMAWNASLMPSIETMTMSLPGFRPASSIAWMAPRAMPSLCANTALMFFPSALRNASISSLPPAGVQLPSWDLMIFIPGWAEIPFSKPFFRSMAGAAPVLPCSSTMLALPLVALASHLAACSPSKTKSEASRVT